MTALFAPLGILIVLIFIAASSSIRIAKEYERGVVFRLGRLIDLKGPGIFFKYPVLDDQRMLSRYLPEVTSATYYLTGPPGMVRGLRTVLTSAGVDGDDVRTEEFTGY